MSPELQHREQLTELRDQYTDRRTVPRQLLDQALGLVDSTVIELQARHEAQVAETDRLHTAYLAQAENRATRAEDRVRYLEALRTNVRESHETIDDGVLVKITAPHTALANGDESPWSRPWTLGELETVAYRLRLGGGIDDTEVRIKHDHTEATVPYPELVLDAPPAKPQPVADRRSLPWWRPYLPAVVAVAMVFVFMAGVLT